jgi:hypothetical protein
MIFRHSHRECELCVGPRRVVDKEGGWVAAGMQECRSAGAFGRAKLTLYTTENDIEIRADIGPIMAFRGSKRTF